MVQIMLGQLFSNFAMMRDEPETGLDRLVKEKDILIVPKGEDSAWKNCSFDKATCSE